MDERLAPRPVADWYMIAAIASLLVMGANCIRFLTHVLARPSGMPLDQQAAMAAEPEWVTLAFGVAPGLEPPAPSYW